MCVSFEAAAFEGTILCLSKAHHPELDREVRVLVYANKPQNKSLEGGNAMLLHFPSKGMTEANMIDTTDFPVIAQNLVDAVGPTNFGDGEDALVFDSGIYTVVLASDIAQIPEALRRVPENKRPAVNQAILDWYGARFPGWSFALCCFDSRDAEIDPPPPLLWWYEQTLSGADSDEIMLPTIDAHTGAPPDLDEEVNVDHWVMIGSQSNESDSMYPVYYSKKLPPLAAALLPKFVTGEYFTGRRMKNGDFVGSLQKALAEGPGTLQRRLMAA